MVINMLVFSENDLYSFEFARIQTMNKKKNKKQKSELCKNVNI